MRIICVFLFFLVVAHFVGFVNGDNNDFNIIRQNSYADGGKCGENVKWTLSDGILTISGTGKMTDFDHYYDVPWSNQTDHIQSVIIQEGVTSIGNHSFENCRILTEVNIPDGVTSIRDSAFSDCSSLTKIELPYTVISIGESAFEGCISLAKLGIPDSVTSIGDSAFHNCNILTEVNIPDGVTSIGDYVFYYCSSLTKVDIPSTVISIGESAFEGCSSLAKLKIPDGVTSIGDYAFSYCSSLTELVIPGRVKSIGESVFERCSSLSSILVDESNSYYASVEGVLFDYNLTIILKYPEGKTNTSYSIPDGVKSIGDDSFYFCSILTEVNIPPDVTSIGDGAFSYCISLTEVALPDSVESIGEGAFERCGNLTKVNIPDGVESIKENTFSYCSSLTEVALPDSVESIEGYAFYHCTSLTKVNIPDGVESIDMYAFSHCSSLTEVSIPDGVESIDMYAFSHCTSLTEVNISDSVTSIGESAFYNCSSLANVNISDSVTSIGESAFYNCSSLPNVNIPRSVISIGNSAFAGCSSLSSIFVDESNMCYASVEGVLFNILLTQILKYPEGKINTSYSIPDGVTSIGESAFEGCSSLTQVNIPKTVTSIGNSAFERCSSLSSIFVDESNLLYASVEGVLFKTSFNHELTEILKYPEGKTNTSYSIPDSVISIGDYAFERCSSLTEVNIPDGVTSIGHYAFEYCSSLTKVNIPAIMTSIGEYAFSYCSGLTKLNIPDGVTSIGECAFEGCSSLTEVNIPDSVTSIGDGAFRGCRSLTEVNIPNGVTSIGWSVFGFCSSLTIIDIPDGVTSIENCAFEFCSSLTEVNIPGSVTSIGESAFEGCSSLTEVIIPASVTTISGQAFEGCSGLSSVYYLGTTTISRSDVFGHNYSALTIFVKESYSGTFCGKGVDRTILGSGSCGDRLKWLIIGSVNKLVITGSGEMSEVYPSVLLLPWHQHHENITTLFIGKSVTLLADLAVEGCNELSSIVVDEGNPMYESNDGVLFSKKRTLIRYPPAKHNNNFDIPKSVSSIAKNAFTGCRYLASIEVDADNDFYTSDGGILFTKNESELVRYPPGMEGNEYSIPESVATIGDFAFEGCSSLSSINIPRSVSTIGRGAFVGCTNLTKVVVEEDNQYFTCIDNVLFSKDYRNLCLCFHSTVVSSYRVPESVKMIDSYAFYGHNELKSIAIPHAVSIGSFAFSHCGSLSSVVTYDTQDQKGVAVIDEMAFEGCSNLASIVIPVYVGLIKSYAFLKCNLSSVTILSENISISSNAFYGCTKLTSMSFFGGGYGVNCSAFKGCGSLKSVNVTESFSNETLCGKNTISIIGGVCGPGMYWVYNSESRSFAVNGSGAMLNYPSSSGRPWSSHLSNVDALTFGDNVNSIGMFAFEGCKVAGNLTLPSSVESIGVGAFSGCDLLSSVVIEGSVKDIGQWAFASCSSLKRVEYYGLTYIPPNNAFKDCNNLTEIKVIETYQNDTFCGIIADHSLATGGCGESLKWLVDKSQRLLTISGSGGMYPVYNSSNIPWNNCTEDITVIVIKEGVTSISNDVFGSCTALSVPDTVTDFGDYSKVTFNDEGENVICIVKRGDSLLKCNDQYNNLKQSLVDYFTYYHVFDGSSEFFNDTVINDDIEFSLKHMIQTEQELNATFYIDKGKSLGSESKLERYFSEYYRITDSEDDHVTYDRNSVLTADVNMTIKALCEMFKNGKSCQNTTSCKWNEKKKICSEGEEESSGNAIAIALGVVGGALVTVAIVIVIVMVVGRRRKKASDQFELDSLGHRIDEIEATIHEEKTKLRLVSKIGKGSFATVWKAESVEDGSLYAVKVVDRFMDEAAKDAQKEAVMLKELDSNFVVGVYDCCEENDVMAIVMEYFELGSLETVLKKQPLSFNVGMMMLYHISRAMKYLHSKNIIHRDLKPGNVLVCSLDPSSPAMCKISDFGEARGVETMEESMTMTGGLGTPYYMAPEMLSNSNHYSSAIDVYSFGIMAAEVVEGKLSFGDELEFDSPYAFGMMVVQGLRPRLDDKCPPPVQSLIQKCWDGTPSKRPLFTAIMGEFEAIIKPDEALLDSTV